VINGAESVLKKNPDFDEYLYITLGDEPAYLESLERLENILTDKAENLTWTVSRRGNEDHGSVPLKSLYDGLEFIYSGWRLPNEVAIQGAEAIQNHYTRLSDKYGFPVKIEEATANMIGYRLMQNNELEKAIEVFRYNVQSYPESANVYDSLGEALEKSGKIEAAADNYRTAVKFGAVTNDPNLDIYKKNLERVDKRE
jgi:tetratricopeptide (TPR) repeat protein